MTADTLKRLLLVLFVCSLPSYSAQTQRATTRPQQVSPAVEAERLNTLGAGYMGMQDFAKALVLFNKAYSTDPGLYAARLNQGIALLNQQKYPPAKVILTEATEREPKNPRTWYNLGLLYKATGDPQAALAAFQKAIEADPADADSRYFAGQLYLDLKRYDQAVEQLERAIAIDPIHASAEYALARAYQRLGQSVKSREHAQRFQKLTRENVSAPLGIGYGQQGNYSLVDARLPQSRPAGPAIAVRFADATVAAGLRFPPGHSAPDTASAVQRGNAVCVFDLDADGWLDVFLGNAGGRSMLLRNVRGKFVKVAMGAVEPAGPASACAVGDFDNNGATDLALSFGGSVRLLRNLKNGRFADVTQASLLAVNDAQALVFSDLDHDGDLDLYVANARGGDLWRNNGNGTFTAAELPKVASRKAVAADLNDDNAVDLAVDGRAILNLREGKFEEGNKWTGTDGETFPLQVADVNRDGWQDLLLATGTGLKLFVNNRGKFSAENLPGELGNSNSATVVDYDNDGWSDIVAVVANTPGTDKLVLLRNQGNGKFQDLSATVGLDRVKLHGSSTLAITDFDNDGDPDIVVAAADGTPMLLRNDGGNRNSWIKLAIRGNADNRSAYGTKAEVFAAGGYQTNDYNGPTGDAGQSNAPMLFGLGDAKSTERIRLRWPTGVVQDEADRAVRQSHTILEIDRRSSSCPLLFTWNGSRFEFISDMIGAGAIGHWVAPGEWNIPDPTEYVKVDGDQLRAENGRLRLRFVEPMEEVNYFDQARLIAVDHPAQVDVYPNERFVSTLPFPEEKIIAARNAKPPLGAWDDKGRNVLSALLRRDRDYVKGFALKKFSGFAEMHTLELEIEPVAADRPLRLLLHGFTEYFTANSMYAAHQAGVIAVAPYVEALANDGTWKRVVDDMGFPAGLPRTMVADLSGKLPAGTRRIRIVTNLQVYWDQVLVDTTPTGKPVTATPARLTKAELRFAGFPKATEGETRGDLRYDYQNVSASGPFATPRGAYTRLGDVKALVTDADDKFVIFAPGEEVALEFDAESLPPLPQGWKRDYFFYADGFVKDMDFYGAQAVTVAPLPFHGMGTYPYPASGHYPDDPDHINYELDYNDRFLFREGSQRYHFDYGHQPQ